MHHEIVDAVQRALREDVGDGDITSELTGPADRVATGAFYAREPMVVAGTELLEVV